jgi:hypothetical protein
MSSFPHINQIKFIVTMVMIVCVARLPVTNNEMLLSYSFLFKKNSKVYDTSLWLMESHPSKDNSIPNRKDFQLIDRNVNGSFWISNDHIMIEN